MKNPSSKIALVTASLALALVGFSAPNANAGHEDDLVRLTHRLEDLASDLRVEFREHYSHTSAYRYLLSDAAKIEGEADHIHRLAHDPYASLRHLRTDVAELDELAHHLHDLVDATDRGRYGHVHGDSRHVHELMDALTGVLHALEDEIDDISHGHGGHDDHHDYHHSSGRGGDFYEGRGYSRGGFRITFSR
ncbi:MAG: hypothetical protein KDN20_15240 [Verrucomicrobiae bacterium]|nr:hypothetical protein [Verrucomicrobiae bacterium]